METNLIKLHISVRDFISVCQLLFLFVIISVLERNTKCHLKMNIQLNIILFKTQISY